MAVAMPLFRWVCLSWWGTYCALTFIMCMWSKMIHRMNVSLICMHEYFVCCIEVHVTCTTQYPIDTTWLQLSPYSHCQLLYHFEVCTHAHSSSPGISARCIKKTGGLDRNATRNKRRHWSQLISSPNVIYKLLWLCTKYSQSFRDICVDFIS